MPMMLCRLCIWLVMPFSLQKRMAFVDAVGCTILATHVSWTLVSSASWAPHQWWNSFWTCIRTHRRLTAVYWDSFGTCLLKSGVASSVLCIRKVLKQHWGFTIHSFKTIDRLDMELCILMWSCCIWVLISSIHVLVEPDWRPKLPGVPYHPRSRVCETQDFQITIWLPGV